MNQNIAKMTLHIKYTVNCTTETKEDHHLFVTLIVNSWPNYSLLNYYGHLQYYVFRQNIFWEATSLQTLADWYGSLLYSCTYYEECVMNLNNSRVIHHIKFKINFTTETTKLSSSSDFCKVIKLVMHQSTRVMMF